MDRDGPLAILPTAIDGQRGYVVVCADCLWRGPHRTHRIDAEDDFDNHDHMEGQ